MDQQKHKPLVFLLADDHSLIRQGIVFLLEEMDFEYEAIHASSLQQLKERITTHPIDIAIIDAHFPDGNILHTLPEIRKACPGSKILIFTGIEESAHALKFLNAGANGFLSKLNEEEEIRQALLTLIREGKYISPATQALLMNSLQNPGLVNPLFSLTEREREIAELYAAGYGNLEIANKLEVKQNTISTLKKRIFDKLQIDNLVELIEMVKNHQ